MKDQMQKLHVVRMSGYELPLPVYSFIAKARADRGVTWRQMYREALIEWARKRPAQPVELEESEEEI